MSKLVSLLKVNFISSIGINKFTKEKSKVERNKSIFLAITIGFTMIMLLVMAVLYFELMAKGLNQFGLLDMLLVMGFIISSAIILFTSIYKAQGILFSFKDYDLLMSLPIKKSDILISKMVELLAVNYFFSLFVLLPSGMIYFKYSNISPLFFINLALIYLALPLIPIVFSSIIAFGISYISSRLKYKNLIITLGTLGVVFLILISSFKVNELISYFVANSASISEGILKIYPPAILAVRGLANNNFVDILLFVILSVLVFSIFVLVFSKSFKSISSRLQESYKKANYKIKEMKSSTQLMALLKKEIKRYFASPIYVINTILGPILLLGMSIATLFMGEEVLATILEVEIVKEIIPLFIIVVVCGILAISCTTNSSISLEGKNLWILKSSPIRPIEIFKAKIGLNLILIVPALLISDIIFMISLKLSAIQFIWLLGISTIFSLVVPIIGIIINLLFPKFNWVSETAVVKQGASVIIQMLISAAIVVIPVLIFIYGKIQNINLFLLGTVIYELIILGATTVILNTTAVKLFNKL
ncbi:ABC transporter permease [Clostridium sp.]|uniref:ABC transporter permease n=1 Tax=Clostridium sp. TaxID=1506 RepID=UPI0025C4FD27|nr:ABC transporter permease [Clostridium sp.]